MHPDDVVRGRAIRLVANKLHPVAHLADGIEEFARHHLGMAAAAGARQLAGARALAAKASAAMAKEAAAKVSATKARAAKAAALKAEAEGGDVIKAGTTAISTDCLPTVTSPKIEPIAIASTDTALESDVAMGEGGGAREVDGAAAGEAEAAAGDEDVIDAAAAAAAAAAAVAAAAAAAVAADEANARVDAAASAAAIAATARHLLLFCALCTRKHALLPLLFDAYAALPQPLQPAVLHSASFDGLVRAVGPVSDPLVAAIACPPKGAESLAKRALEVLAEVTTSVAPAAAAAATAAAAAGEGAAPPPPPPTAVPTKLVAAAESLAAANGDDVTYLIPLLGSLSAERVRVLLPQLVAQPLEVIRV